MELSTGSWSSAKNGSWRAERLSIFRKKVTAGIKNVIINSNISFILFTHDKPEAAGCGGHFILEIFNADNVKC